MKARTTLLPNEVRNKTKRMYSGLYTLVSLRQLLADSRYTRIPPKDWFDMIERFAQWDETRDRELYSQALSLADELFGRRPYDEDGHQLYQVEELTLKESAIAGRMDWTHGEKIERIKPLREKRRADAEARAARPYKPTKLEREYRENKRRREAEEAALSPEEREWRRRNKERIDAWLDSLTAPFVGTTEDAEDEYGDLPSSLFTPVAPVVPVNVVERTFNDHITDAGRIHARGMGIRLV